ncbi:MAG: toxin-antitoxin system HicB family antitoxin [Solirubrobacterales bacterium]
MHQLTLRIGDELADNLRLEAKKRGKSVNALVATVLSALLDPALEGDEFERLRARLERAGLLADAGPRRGARAPSEKQLAQARRVAGSGKNLSEYVSEGRD